MKRAGTKRERAAGVKAGALAGAVLAALTFLIAPACGSATNEDDPCNKLVARLQAECPDIVMTTSSGQLNCSGAAACAANCALKASCDDIRNNAKSYSDCTNACK